MTLLGHLYYISPLVITLNTISNFSFTSVGEKYSAFQLLNASLCSASTHYVKMMKHSSELIGTAVSIGDYPKSF